MPRFLTRAAFSACRRALFAALVCLAPLVATAQDVAEIATAAVPGGGEPVIVREADGTVHVRATRINRPRQIYTGATERDYLPVDQR